MTYCVLFTKKGATKHHTYKTMLQSFWHRISPGVKDDSDNVQYLADAYFEDIRLGRLICDLEKDNIVRNISVNSYTRNTIPSDWGSYYEVVKGKKSYTYKQEPIWLDLKVQAKTHLLQLPEKYYGLVPLIVYNNEPNNTTVCTMNPLNSVPMLYPMIFTQRVKKHNLELFCRCHHDKDTHMDLISSESPEKPRKVSKGTEIIKAKDLEYRNWTPLVITKNISRELVKWEEEDEANSYPNYVRVYAYVIEVCDDR